MSDSLNATVIVSRLVLMISAKPELELDDELVPPRLPEAVDEAVALELLAAAELLEPLETACPGDTLSREAIVPLVGANSRVLVTPVSAVRTVASALSTDASAEAMLAGDGVVVVVVLVAAAVVLAPDFEEPDLDEPDVDEPELVVRLGVVGVRAGVVTVTVRVMTGAGAVLLGVVVVAVGVVEAAVVVVVVVVLVVVVVGALSFRTSSTNSVLGDDVSSLVSDALDPPVPLEPDDDDVPSFTEVSWSWAAVRLSSA